MLKTAMYLRKSRAEELKTNEETLLRHKEQLMSFAEKNKLQIVDIFEEVVSGESLFARPEMLKLLQNVENEIYDAVICMDIDRLGRGNMQEQGAILEAFKASGTKIITPRKIYDLNDEFDEEYSEFEAFMARKELKIIKRRLRTGIKKTVSDGGYIANAPFGYDKITINNRPSLKPNKEEAEIVKTIFNMYIDGKGSNQISDYINALGAKPRRGSKFNRNTVRYILKNPVYIGKIVWDRKTHIRKGGEGTKNKIIYNPENKWNITEGLHEPIISEEIFNKARDIRLNKECVPHNTGVIRNPLAGLIVCAVCGHKLQMQDDKNKEQPPHLLCTTKGCCRGTRVDKVETVIIQKLKEIVEEYQFDVPVLTDTTSNSENIRNAIENSNSAIDVLKTQLNSLYDLLEQKVYDIEIFTERKKYIDNEIAKHSRNIDNLNNILAKKSRSVNDLIPEINGMLEEYDILTPEEKNKILKKIINYVVYSKTKKQWDTNFDIQIVLNL
ncbi:MAG: recombinase family protein [Oscillospiraceae bacterium]|nr:recombinase family protein [Oscillospiraceae bacterium]